VTPALALAALLAVPQEPEPAPAVRFTVASPFEPGRVVPTPPESPLTEEAFDLGRRLFHEASLSGSGQMACATCHIPERGFAEPLPRARGDAALRNTPTLYNAAFGERFGWDGRASSLEEFALLPIANPREMALPLADAVAWLGADAGYAGAFRQVYGAPPSAPLLARALATYLRAITLGDSPVDRFQRAEPSTLTREEKAGLWVYESRGRCWKCHPQPGFTDDGFHNTGVGAVDGAPTDPGRIAVTGADADRGAFKTPTLRGLAFTAPYMHDGSLATLEEVVGFYRRGGNPNPWLDPAMEPLDLTDDDARHLVAFLRALSRVEPPAAADRRR
jgi:cytochrome c peroxidase